jgi:hypothetical protein
MFVVGILSWWYSAGWRQRLAMLQERLAKTTDYFSIDLLAKTLFAPFRQIAAGRVDGPLSVKLHAFFDRLTSRMIGAAVRSIMIFVGILAIFAHSLIGFVSLVIWALIPALPVLGITLFISGWTPWSL